MQYLVGEWDFRDITLELAPPTLIPRPETEELVGLALSTLPRDRPVRFLDIGCGSGAIALSILHERPAARGVAMDIQSNAVQLTGRNAERLGLSKRLEVVCEDIRSRSISPQDGQFDLVVSNPPYLTTSEMDGLEEELR